jgi:hypothetical protein
MRIAISDVLIGENQCFLVSKMTCSPVSRFWSISFTPDLPPQVPRAEDVHTG